MTGRNVLGEGRLDGLAVPGATTLVACARHWTG